VSSDASWFGRRVWTPGEAAAALPLVRRIVDDLVDCYRRWQDAVEAFEYAAGAARPDEPHGTAERLMGDAQALAAEIDGLRDELEALDIRVTRVDRGLVAFRGESDGQVVPIFWAPEMPAPSYDWPDSVPAYGTSVSWPSRAQVVAGKRSRA